MTSIGKENRSSQCLSYKKKTVREKKGAGGWGERKKTRRGGGGHSHKQSEGLGGVAWVYKIGLK